MRIRTGPPPRTAAVLAAVLAALTASLTASAGSDAAQAQQGAREEVRQETRQERQEEPQGAARGGTRQPSGRRVAAAPQAEANPFRPAGVPGNYLFDRARPGRSADSRKKGSEPGVRVTERGLSLVSDDREVKVRIGGRLHLDSNSFRAQPRIGSVGEPFLIRRGWIETYLNLRDEWEAALQLDTANPVLPIQDAVIAYRGFKPVVVTAGNVREPFSLQQLMSINQITFIERASADALTPGRNTGVVVATNGERWTLVGGAFFGNINRGVELNGTAGTARATVAPYLDGTDVVHLGAAGSYRRFDGNDRAVVFNPQTEIDAFGASLITTRQLRDARDVSRIGLEGAWQLGRLRLQGEYVRAEVGLAPGTAAMGAGRTARFDSGYVQASLALNGPARTYRLEANYGTAFGIFGDVALPDELRLSRGGPGAFELSARYDTLDLSEAPTGGGTEANWTIGLTWRPELNVKVLANYTNLDIRRPVSAGGDTRIDLTEVRLQYYW